MKKYLLHEGFGKVNKKDTSSNQNQEDTGIIDSINRATSFDNLKRTFGFLYDGFKQILLYDIKITDNSSKWDLLNSELYDKVLNMNEFCKYNIYNRLKEDEYGDIKINVKKILSTFEACKMYHAIETNSDFEFYVNVYNQDILNLRIDDDYVENINDKQIEDLVNFLQNKHVKLTKNINNIFSSIFKNQVKFLPIVSLKYIESQRGTKEQLEDCIYNCILLYNMYERLMDSAFYFDDDPTTIEEKFKEQLHKTINSINLYKDSYFNYYLFPDPDPYIKNRPFFNIDRRHIRVSSWFNKSNYTEGLIRIYNAINNQIPNVFTYKHKISIPNIFYRAETPSKDICGNINFYLNKFKHGDIELYDKNNNIANSIIFDFMLDSSYFSKENDRNTYERAGTLQSYIFRCKTINKSIIENQYNDFLKDVTFYNDFDLYTEDHNSSMDATSLKFYCTFNYLDNTVDNLIIECCTKFATYDYKKYPEPPAKNKIKYKTPYVTITKEETPDLYLVVKHIMNDSVSRFMKTVPDKYEVCTITGAMSISLLTGPINNSNKFNPYLLITTDVYLPVLEKTETFNYSYFIVNDDFKITKN